MEIERANSGNGVDLVELQFLISKLTHIINILEGDSSKHTFLLRNLTRLPKKLRDLKEALASNDKHIQKKESFYRIKNVLIDWESHRNKSSLHSYYALYHFLSKITTLRNELNSTDETILQIDQSICTPWFPELTTRFPDANAHGIEDKISTLVRILSLRRENDGMEMKTVGISGMKGVGKTMLCQQVFRHEIVQSFFLPRIWVCLSRIEGEDELDHRIVVVKRMLKALGVEEDVVSFAETKHSLEGLLYVLRLQLVGKNYLIVLDDAWKKDEEEFYSGLDKDEILSTKLAYGLPKGYGGAVVVTSRWQEMVDLMMDKDRSHCLTSNLDSESCWMVFKEEAEKEGVRLSNDLISLKDEIVKNCDGLPLAAKLLGELARKNYEKEIQAQQSSSIQMIES
ncbi:probable disease resistance protein At5g45490 [Impatiens glandulifera]|uniref:probable disease resistance protein At5g45490 n=1 Tax=Impatiens glandulifera TaxID=253017 RepID=UPI001FB0ED2E|nr:probable disease resistance protein At5g45490 [Impatiens glandulifera]